MESYHLPEDITVYCITASSFPMGVMDAHKQLHALIPFSEKRRYFAVSRPDQTKTIIYKAAAEELEKGELEKHGLEMFTIRKGEYISTIVHDYMKDLSAIGKTFRQMIADPRIDPDGACVEWYISRQDVQCMVRLKDN